MEITKKIIAGSIFLIFWIFSGVMVSPVWLLVSVTGALLGVYSFKEVPRIFWGLFTIKWIFDEE